MANQPQPKVAIVDYGMGNLFSVRHACAYVGLDAEITNDKETILRSAAVILPGIGAFGDAIETLRRHDLVSILRDVVAAEKPFLGVCLGMQLLMTESCEFGIHKGLGVVEGDVVRLSDTEGGFHLKVPHIGWSRVETVRSWNGSLMESLSDGTFMYFVHSYYTRPAAQQIVWSRTRFGSTEFCSSFGRNNMFACQFHPERSGPEGLKIYQKFAAAVNLVTVEYRS